MNKDKLSYALGIYGDVATIKKVAKLNSISEEDVIENIYKSKQTNPFPKEVQHYCGGRLIKQTNSIEYKCNNKKCHRHRKCIHGACTLTPNTFEVDMINTTKHKKVTYFVDKDLKITNVKYHEQKQF